MLGRVKCILYVGVVTGWIGLTPAPCQQPVETEAWPALLLTGVPEKSI